MNIRLKILLSIVVATLAATLVVGMVSVFGTRTIASAAETKDVMGARSTLRGYMKDMENQIDRAARVAAADQELVSGLAEFLQNGNRLRLNNVVMNIVQHGHIDFLTVTDMSGTVAMRSHQPSKFGDSDANLQHIKRAMGGKISTAYESSASNPIALRCGVPVMKDGKQIGVASAGCNLGSNVFVDKIKAFTGADVTMFLHDKRVATTILNIRGERNVDTKADAGIYKQISDGKDVIGRTKVAGRRFLVYYSPIRDAADSVFGMTSVAADITDADKQMRNTVITIIVIMLVLCAAAVFVGLYIAGDIAKPLSATVNMMSELGRGHLDVRLNLNRKDEIGVMAKAVDAFADDMQKVVIGTMKRISAGDLSAKIEPKDERDEISGALKGTVESLNVVVGAMKRISEGDLSVVIESKDENDEISNALKKTVESLHSLIIDDGGSVLNAAANKDLSQRLTREYQGVFATMKNNINTVMQNLEDALGHVASSISQVSSASNEIARGAQSLAESSSEQASSLEEVSSSLEAMSSMTRHNAGNTNQAMILASEARVAANDGDISMKHMAMAINQIKQSADNTAKIIKTIDDIAFQTNLLALNAAVEAARAGEAGKGFAVVAEEVRNLALLSADAAKNTANMIEESVKNADGGVKITAEVAQSLNRIVERTGKVGDLIAEVAAVCNEQAQGIEQVNVAVSQMSQVTQQNAANSEESASASEELSSQAAELANMVREFKLSADGGAHFTGHGSNNSDVHQPQNRRFALISGRRTDDYRASGSGTKSIKAVKAGEVIPLDEEELSEF
jgi:methyl-accepting chemotaxis protein